MKDYWATVKLQQGRMRTCMAQLGIRTATELARRCHLSCTTVGRLLNFKSPPKTKAGEWQVSVQRICDVLGADPTDVFPDHLQDVLPTNIIGRMIDKEEIERAIGPAPEQTPLELCAENEERTLVHEALNSRLTPREKEVLLLRFVEEESLENIAQHFHRTRETIRQIEAKAMRKMRHACSPICAVGEDRRTTRKRRRTR